MKQRIDRYGKDRLLQYILDEVKDRCTPDDVFDEEELTYWASFNKKPQEIFMNGELDEWAKDNGYIKADDI